MSGPRWGFEERGGNCVSCISGFPPPSSGSLYFPVDDGIGLKSSENEE